MGHLALCSRPSTDGTDLNPKGDRCVPAPAGDKGDGLGWKPYSRVLPSASLPRAVLSERSSLGTGLCPASVAAGTSCSSHLG